MGKFSRFSNENIVDSTPTVLKQDRKTIKTDVKVKSIKIKEANYKQLAILKATTGTSFIELLDLAVSMLVDEPQYQKVIDSIRK